MEKDVSCYILKCFYQERTNYVQFLDPVRECEGLFVIF